MPPTRGHDLKPVKEAAQPGIIMMPPTRGHDLKHGGHILAAVHFPMPPTRGHDLKPCANHVGNNNAGCPPHGGTT